MAIVSISHKNLLTDPRDLCSAPVSPPGAGSRLARPAAAPSGRSWLIAPSRSELLACSAKLRHRSESRGARPQRCQFPCRRSNRTVGAMRVGRFLTRHINGALTAARRTARMPRSPEASMAHLVIVYWRDIPSQVIVKAGRRSEKRHASDRFQEAIDMAAMRCGSAGHRRLPEEWRRAAPVAVGDELAGRPSGARRDSKRTTIASGSRRSSAMAAGRKRRTSRRGTMTQTLLASAIERGHHRLRPAVLRHRRADQPDRAQEARGRDDGRATSRRQPDALAQVQAGAIFSTSMPASPRSSQRDRAAAPAPDARDRAALTDIPLCIDSSVIAALKAGLRRSRAGRWSIR